MTIQKIAIGLVAVALFVGSMTAHAADFSMGYEAYQRGDYATALRIFRQLAEQGDASAQYNLAFMYDNGRGVTQDYAEAMRWYRKAAGQGEASAQYNLGVIFFKGQGVTQDYAEAMKWFRIAADQGHVRAQTGVGLIYDLGRGVTQDYVQAHMWYNIAAAQGQKDAGKWRDSLAEKMTPTQIAEAQKLARYWKPRGK